MASLRNGSARSWLDKWTWEIVRLILVMVASLGLAYLGFSREHNALIDKVDSECAAVEHVRENQETVLLTLLSIDDVLRDRQKVGLAPLPPYIRANILRGLGRLPDERKC